MPRLQMLEVALLSELDFNRTRPSVPMLLVPLPGLPLGAEGVQGTPPINLQEMRMMTKSSIHRGPSVPRASSFPRASSPSTWNQMRTMTKSNTHRGPIVCPVSSWTHVSRLLGQDWGAMAQLIALAQ